MIRQRRRGAALSTGLLIAVTVLGVLLMHSVVAPSMAGSMAASEPVSAAMSGNHVAMASTTTAGSSVLMASAKHDCPSGHQMMHPCVGTTVSWPALHVPAINTDIGQLPTSADRIGERTDFALERAPPWTMWELDRSVTLRV